MSAGVEATATNPTTESKDEVKAAEATTATSDNKKDTDMTEAANEEGEKRSKMKSDGAALDDKYSKHSGDRKDNRNGHGKNGNYRGRDGYSNSRGRGGNNQRGNFKSRNIKSNYEDQEKSSDPAEIRKQVEFYFSDGNLAQDKFLYTKIGGGDNNAVDIKIIATFKRMRRFEPYSAIVSALKDSKVLEVVNGDKPNDEQVRRRTPLPASLHNIEHDNVAQHYVEKARPRTIYAKGFGDETKRTQLEVEEYFAPYGVLTVRLRRTQDGTFKGSAFVEFPTEDEAKQFVDMDKESRPKWKDNVDLDVKTKEDYCNQKVDMINEGKLRPNGSDDEGGEKKEYRSRDGGGFRGRGRGRGRGDRNGGDRRDRDGGRYNNRRRDRSGSRDRDLRNDDWKEMRERDRKGKGENKESKGEEQEYDDVGIPKIKATAPATETESKKRPAEEEGGEDREAKKAKEE